MEQGRSKVLRNNDFRGYREDEELYVYDQSCQNCRYYCDWDDKGRHGKCTQIKGYILGLLKDEGVLKGSYDSIAARVGLTDEPRTLSRYMGQGKKQPYAEWVKESVAGNFSSLTEIIGQTFGC